MELTAVLSPAEEGGFIALNPETGTTSQGDTIQEALESLKEATELYLSEFPESTPGVGRLPGPFLKVAHPAQIDILPDECE